MAGRERLGSPHVERSEYDEEGTQGATPRPRYTMSRNNKRHRTDSHQESY